MQTNRVYINSYRVVCSAGDSAEELFDNICAGKSGIQTNDTFFDGHIVGIGISKTDIQKALLKEVESLLKNSGLKDFKDTLLVVGSSAGGMRLTEKIYLKCNNYKKVTPSLHTIGSISQRIFQRFEFKDSVSVSTACTSGANALGYAREVIAKDIYQNALVVGYDALCKTTVGGFEALGVLDKTACKPFDKDRNGMNVAEGLGILLLQNKQAENSVEICGAGYSSDAFHMTQPDPNGAKKAMQNALACKGLNPEDIDYINAHGTGTLANDSSEINAVKELFGTRVPISSTKSITGHTLGAAGAIEAILSAMVLQKQKLVPNHNLKDPEVSGMNYVCQEEDKKIDYVLSNSFAFGGNNTSLLFGVVK